MSKRAANFARRPAALVCCLTASFVALGGELQSLTVCADPGNMPLSNQKGEGFENKIALTACTPVFCHLVSPSKGRQLCCFLRCRPRSR